MVRITRGLDHKSWLWLLMIALFVVHANPVGAQTAVVETERPLARSAPDSSSADELSAEVISKIDEAARQSMEGSHLPGVAVVVVKDGQTIFKRGYGLANVEEGTLVDPDKTLFRIGSISKAVTFLALTRQIDQGRLAMDEDVTKYIDGISNPNGFSEPVTIENLLTHTSGFDQIGGRDRQVYNFDDSLAVRMSQRPAIDAYLSANHLRRVSHAGEYYRYDTYGSMLAGVVLQRVVGVPYRDAMQKELFGQLGMTRSFVEVAPELRNDLALGYGNVDGEYEAQPYEVFVTTPASSIDATPADMGRLLEALTGEGKNEHGRLFSKATTKAVLAPQFRSHPEFLGVTHGMMESRIRIGGNRQNVRTVGHGGSMRGYIATMEIVPEHNLGVFVVTNRAPEAGGGEVHLGPVLEAIFSSLPDIESRKLYPIPDVEHEVDLSEYVADYHYGVFCHSGNARDFANGAWRRGRSRAVTSNGKTLTISDAQYLPRGDDIFVRNDGQQMVYFGRNDAGAITHYVFATSPDTFERVMD